jgi:exosome complex component RRP42
VIDPTPEEEQCMSLQLTVGVDKYGNFCGMIKSGRGGIDPSGIVEMLQVCYC